MLELLRLFVALFNLLVIFKVVKELAPSDELFVVDSFVLFRQLHHLIHLVALNLIEDLVKSHDL